MTVKQEKEAQAGGLNAEEASTGVIRLPDSTGFWHYVSSELVALNPASALLVGQENESLLKALANCKVERLIGDTFSVQLQDRPKYDLAVLSEVLEHMNKEDAAILLSRLRDLYAGSLLVIVPIGPDWPATDTRWEANEMLAFGFSLQAEYRDQGRPFHLYRYEIGTYKPTPPWLNSRNWANPELFNKHRW